MDIEIKVVHAGEVQSLVDAAVHNVHYAHFIKRDLNARPMPFAVPGHGCGIEVPESRKSADAARRLLTVWDVNVGNYRRINLLTVDHFEIDGQDIRVVP